VVLRLQFNGGTAPHVLEKANVVRRTWRMHISCQSVKLHLRHKQQTDKCCLFVCLTVCPTVVSVRGVHPMGGRSAMLRRNLRWEGGAVKIWDQPANTRYLVSWLSGKSIKLLLPSCHSLKLKRIKFVSVRSSLCSFVRLCLRWSLTIYPFC